MQDRIQTIYEELCCTLENMNIEQRYYLALMGMSRTLCICPRLAEYDFFQDIDRLTEFMEKNSKDIFEHKQVYNGYRELKALFEGYSEQWEDFLYTDGKESQDAVITGCSDDFLSEWYGFLGAICASDKYITPERTAGNMTLPIRCLDGYLRDYLFYHKGRMKDEQLQDFINEHDAINNEAERISSDIQTVLNSDPETIYKRLYSYSKLNIFEGLES